MEYDRASKTEYWTFFGGRLFAGLCAGPVEALLPTTITDIFFLHDRGEKVAIYGLSMLGGYEIGPVISAYVIQYLGMDWAFYVIAIALGAAFIAILLFMPETAYHGQRPAIHVRGPATEGEAKTPSSMLDAMQESVQKSQPSELVSESKTASESESASGSVETPLKHYFDTLKFWSKDAVDPNLTIAKAFLRPFVLCA